MTTFNNFKNEAEYQKYLAELFKRYEDGQNLTYDEANFMCGCMEYEHQKSHSICDELRYKRLFLKKFESKQKNYALEPFEEDDLKSFLEEWKIEMKKENHSSNFMNLIAKETRTELKKIAIDFTFLDKIFRHRKYRSEQREILGYSKFIYIKVKSIFIDIPSKKIDTQLNRINIEIDEYSIIHIFFRHYGQLAKPYNTQDKSFFTPEIRVEEIPTVLKNIIDMIDSSKLYINDDFNNINFCYKQRDYKVYCKKVTKQIKGQGNVDFNRVNTFYPIELKEDLDKLVHYSLVKINSKLSVYIKNRS